MAFYDLIFQGQMIDSASLDSSSLQQRKNNIARLFNADAEKASKLFSGKPIVIKKNLAKETAEKYVSVLKKAGALVHAVEIQVIGQDNYTADSSGKERLSNKNQIDTTSPVSATSSGDSLSGLSAGLSALLNYNQHVQQPEPEATLSNTSDSADAVHKLHLAPIGTDFSDLKKNIEPVKIADISHISLAESHTGSLQEFTKKAAPVKIPDISSLSMSEAQQGSLEGIIHKQDPVELPDISHIKFSSE